MQYKIPVQIENEDKIFLNLSIRQLSIVMVAWGIGYSIFKSMEPNVGAEIALFPTVLVTGAWVVIALFRHTEMTFLPFMLNLIRLNLNVPVRSWSKWVDGYSNLEVGYVQSNEQKETGFEQKSSHEAYESVEEQLSKI